MPVPQHVLNWLYSVLTSEYQDVNRTYNDVAQALSGHPGLSPRTDVHTFIDGKSALLVHLSGTLPVVFRGATYRFPISVWVPHAYPREAPLVYVNPTEKMVVRPGQHVDPQGQVYHPYLAAWSRFWDKSTLFDFLAILTDVFAKEPPVISRPPQQSPQQGQSGTPPSQTRSPAPVSPAPPEIPRPPSHYSRQASDAPQPPPPPPKPVAEAPSPPSLPTGPPKLPPKPTSHAAPAPALATPPQIGSPPATPHAPIEQNVPNRSSRYDSAPPLPQQVQPPVPQHARPGHPEYMTTDPNWRPAVSHQQQPMPPIQPQQPAVRWDAVPPVPPQEREPHPPPPMQRVPPPNFLDEPVEALLPKPSFAPAPPIPPNPEKDALLRQLAKTLYLHREKSREQNESCMLGLQAQRTAMTVAYNRLNSERTGLSQVSALLSSNAQILRDALHNADAVIENSRQHPKPDIDELLVAPTVVANQLYALVAEERAIADIIFVLGRAVERGRISPAVFAKTTRSLAREWYLKKALVKKIGRGMGLDVTPRP
ncbi:related to tumor susceptibility gene 101 protein [Cephalotrichum gorgonifer]|uniref:Related to tumor susceptibility gene 101 protein n=1 Tax=Cephalotrichum gorgonifer TaxID=2041049 RepID=A0AAE8MTS9_9PEZI|nr:related to tumor susceptibility gene 101 protein [Cephalotrichum gorgonifer]